MVELLNLCISDDAGIRHIQIVETVLSHCPHVLWPNDMEKLKRAAAWAHRLRDCLRAHGFSLGSRSASIRSSVVSTPRRAGPNGLSSVGSVDCVNNNMPHKHARTSTQPPGLSATDAQDSAEGTLNIPAKSSSEKDNRAANTNLSPPSSGTTCKPANGSSASHANCAHSRSADGKDRSPVPSEASFGELSKLGAHIMEADDFPLRTHRLSGGITNELFHVYDSEDPTTGLVIRVFGKETDRVISRESELFYQSLFIPTYVQGGNFLTYEFLVGYDTLPYTDMEAEWQAIADALAEFQVRATAASRVNIPVAERTVASCNSSEEDVFQLQCESVPHRSTKVTTGKEREEPDNRFDRETNYTICSLTEWVEQTKSEEIMEKVDASRRKEFASVAQHLERECTWMMEILKREEEHLGEGVCHNDLLSANIMRAENEDHSGPHLRIIDFDYTRRNYLLFDIANHFNEYTGLECDYARFFPSTEQMKDFIAAYRASMRSHLEAVAEANPDGVFPRERELFWTASPADEEVVVERWTGLVKLLTLSSHLSWAVWSLVQEAVSVLDVDFLEYAKLRLARYVETKEEFSAGY